jgi:hypothetical protein
MIDHLLGMCEALGSILILEKKGRGWEGREKQSKEYNRRLGEEAGG